MKKTISLPMVLSIVFLVVFVIGCVAKDSQVVVPQQQGVLRFEGDWIISDYQEGGNKTLKLDGDIVKIFKENNIYYVTGPNDWLFLKSPKFRAERHDLLVGRYIPIFNDLKEMYIGVSGNLLANARGKIILAGTLSMKNNDIIVVEYNYWQILTSNGNFNRVKETPRFYRFVLTRKK